MSSDMPQLDGIAAALGGGWRHNRVIQSGYCHYLTNGNQKIQIMYVSGSSKQKVNMSLVFAPYIAQQRDHNCSIGISINRSSKAIAADIKRRLLPGYAEHLQQAIEARKADQDKKEMDRFIIETFRKIIPLQTTGRDHYFGDSYSDLPKGTITQNYHRGDEISLNIHNLTPEQACKILAIIQPDIIKAEQKRQERKQREQERRAEILRKRKELHKEKTA